ncbi:MAG: hypothetical protein AB1352_02630 [Patescibacteria group bacterium]
MKLRIFIIAILWLLPLTVKAQTSSTPINPVTTTLRPWLLTLDTSLVNSILTSPLTRGDSRGNGVKVYFFWAKGCPHCADEKPFLDALTQEYLQIEVTSYEVNGNAENAKLLQKVGTYLNADATRIPFTMVGSQYVIGWLNEETTGNQIRAMIASCMNVSCMDVVERVTTPSMNQPTTTDRANLQTLPEYVTVPLIGQVRIRNLSLPALTILFGALDGFNPCAMWVLIFLISLLLGMQDKVRMWVLGGTFLVASSAVYFLFMAAWLNALLFFGFVIWIRLGIAAVALAAGGYNLKEYFLNPTGACKVTENDKRKNIFEQLKRISQQKKFAIAFFGIIALACAVNFVELICSAGFPAVYTNLLTLSLLPRWQYYAYLLLYISFFMLDDLIIFITAMVTLQITGITSKYTRYSHLVGGLLLFAIGILLIFRPGWLMFG